MSSVVQYSYCTHAPHIRLHCLSVQISYGNLELVQVSWCIHTLWHTQLSCVPMFHFIGHYTSPVEEIVAMATTNEKVFPIEEHVHIRLHCLPTN